MSEQRLIAVFDLYRGVVARACFRRLAESYLSHAWFYSLTVTCWLMIRQRLEARGTLQSAVKSLLREECRRLLTRKQRRRAKRASAGTGAYSQAQSNVPVEGMRMVVSTIGQALLEQVRVDEEDEPVALLDGSSLQCVHTAELAREFPPAENQHGRSHWPVMRLVVLHDLHSGLATVPVAFGPMYGPQATSEQQLAEQLLDQAPSGTTIVADRNFGIFAIAYACQQRQLPAVVRLTKVRAASLAAGALLSGTVAEVRWRPSGYERRAHPGLPLEAEVSGRLIVFDVPGFRDTLYLFTTLGGSAERIVEMYGLRWNVETDLRAIKQTLQMGRLSSKSRAMVEKELLAGLAAYNLVRAAIAITAREANLDPRSLSFSRVLSLVTAFLPDLLADSKDRAARRRVRRLMKLILQCALPRRPHPRAFPRAVWRRGYRFPLRQVSTVVEPVSPVVEPK